MANCSNCPPTPSETFCILPWVHLFLDEQGHVLPCCQSSRDAAGQLQELHVGDIFDQHRNAAALRKVRLKMLAGEKPSTCARCFHDEELGLRSYRQDSNALFGEHIQSAVANTLENGALHATRVRSIDVRLGNQCNLKCRMCTPVASKQLIPEWRALLPLAEENQWLEGLQHMDWFEQPELWTAIEREMETIDTVQFAGGESLLLPRMVDFLERMIASGRAESISLTYITNLTPVVPRIIKLWRSFKHVHVIGSVDAFGPLNSFIRYPSRWETIDSSLKLLDQEAKLGPISITINTTIQIYNIFDLSKLVEYVLSSFVNVHSFPHLSILYIPKPFDIRVLPLSLKKLAADRLNAFLESGLGKTRPGYDGFVSAVNGVITHMMSADLTGLIPEFVRWNALFDDVRRQNVLDVVPELRQMLCGVASSGEGKTDPPASRSGSSDA